MNITDFLSNNEEYKHCYKIDNEGCYVQTEDLWLPSKEITTLNNFKQNGWLYLAGNPIISKYFNNLIH